MKKNHLKLSIPCTWIDIPKKGGSLCNPKFGEAKINFHVYGKSSVSIIASELPEFPVEISVDIKQLKVVNDFLIKVIEE